MFLIFTQIWFYGTQNTGVVLEKNIVPFKDAQDVIRLLLLRDLFGFLKGIREVERELNIPDELSITKDQKSVN